MRAKLLVVAIAAGAASLAVGTTYAAFNSSTSNPASSFSAKRIFPGVRSLSAWNLRDASSGTEANSSDPLSFGGDGLTDVSNGNIASGSNVYLELTMSAQLPAGRPVSGATFRFSLASNGGLGSENGCFWFEVRSGGSVIGTHGSYASAAGCSNKTTLTQFDTSMPEVTTADVTNGLVVRAYAWESKGKKVKVDLATVTGSTPSTSFTMYERQVVDTSSGTVTTPWSPATVDGTTFTSASAWPTSAATTKYVKLTFDPAVPTGAVVSSAALTFVYKPSAAVTSPGLCHYVDVLKGGTLLASHGSSSSAYSCNTSGSGYVTDSISLPEVDTPAEANSLVVKIYMWGASCGAGCPKSNVEQGQLSLNYYLD